jgi:hypothetical protein
MKKQTTTREAIAMYFEKLKYMEHFRLYKMFRFIYRKTKRKPTHETIMREMRRMRSDYKDINYRVLDSEKGLYVKWPLNEDILLNVRN